MGILDRLRRSGSASAPEPTPQAADIAPEPTLAEPPAPESADITAPADGGASDGRASMGEQRGDFMLLPPLRPTFGLPERFQHAVSEFAVTRRPMTVTDEPLTHAVEPERMGTFVARARRTRGRPRPRRSDLVHRQDEALSEFEDVIEEPAPLPPAPAPRRLKATPPPATPVPAPAPEPQLPSIGEVRRAVVNPAPVPPRATTAIEGRVLASNEARASGATPTPFDPTTLPRAARSEITDDVPVIRRRPSRGRVAEPITNSEDEENAELLEHFVQGITAGDPQDEVRPSIPIPPMPAGDPGVMPDELPAPRAADLPPLTGPTRVRGAAPPEIAAAEPADASTDAVPVLPAPTAADRPTLANAAALTATPAPVPTDVAQVPSAPELAHRSAPEPSDAESVGDASERIGGPAAPSGPAPAAAPAAPSGPAPVAPAAPPSVIVQPNRPAASADDAGGDTAVPDRSAPRPTLGSRGPLVSSGRTGVQRLARGDDDGRPPLAQPARSIRSAATPTPAAPTPPAPMPAAPAPSAAPAVPSGPAPSATPGSTSASSPSDDSTDEPTPAEPTVLPVPQAVREAVAKAVGTSPATVPVHQGDHTDAMTDEINAQAFTRDGEIHLAGDVSLATPEGQAVLAHELTHVVQQRGGSQAMPHESSEEGQAHEEQAREVQRTLLAPPTPSEPGELALAAPPAQIPSLPGGSPSGASALTGGAPAADIAAPGVQRLARPAPPAAPAVGSAPASSAPAAPMPPAPAARARAAVRSPASSTASALDTLGPSKASSKPESQVVVAPGVQRNRRRSEFDDMFEAPMELNHARRNATATTRADELDRFVAAPAEHNATRRNAVIENEAAFEPFGGEDVQEQSKPKWYQSGGKLDSMFSSEQVYDDVDDDDEDDPRAGLERQAESLYPLIRARLRAELVRDRERRGRLAREWR